jgi:hypothetical protein
VTVAIVGPLAALVGVLVGGLLTYSSEYRKWLRAERHKAVTELLAAGEAMRRHSAARIAARYAASRLVDLEQAAGALDPEIHLADLERIDLASEAMRTLFPTVVVELVEEFCAAAQALPHVEFTARAADEPAKGAGEMYFASRAKLVRAVRTMIAANLTERLRLRVPRSRQHQSDRRTKVAV